MSFIERIKSLAGGKGSDRTVTAAATLQVPDNENFFYVSGTATVTSLLASASTRRREITICAAGTTNVAFTNTNSPTVAGTMNLLGVNRTITDDKTIKMYLKPDGTWVLSGGTY